MALPGRVSVLLGAPCAADGTQGAKSVIDLAIRRAIGFEMARGGDDKAEGATL